MLRDPIPSCKIAARVEMTSVNLCFSEALKSRELARNTEPHSAPDLLIWVNCVSQDTQANSFIHICKSEKDWLGVPRAN